MSYNYVLTERKDRIFTITLNRPEVLNAFPWSMIIELNHAFHDADEDEDARVVVITGAGRAFSAGMDLKVGLQSEEAKVDQDREIIPIPTLLFKHFQKPVIAAINGPAIGWGLTLALLCDLRIAAESATLSIRFTQVGLIPEAGSPYLLPRIVGVGKALELALTAKTIDAHEAKRINLVHEVVPDDQLLEYTYDLAKDIAEKSPLAIKLARESIYRALESDFEQQQAKETEDFTRCLSSEEFRMSAKKFAEKKK